jgi:hypothetical protein
MPIMGWKTGRLLPKTKPAESVLCRPRILRLAHFFDIRGLRALLPLHNFELHLVAFSQ